MQSSSSPGYEAITVVRLRATFWHSARLLNEEQFGWKVVIGIGIGIGISISISISISLSPSASASTNTLIWWYGCEMRREYDQTGRRIRITMFAVRSQWRCHTFFTFITIESDSIRFLYFLCNDLLEFTTGKCYT